MGTTTIECSTMYKDRKQYLEYRKHKWTSGVIAISWILNLRYRVMKKKLKARQRTQYEHYTSRFKVFQKNWKEINSNKRVIIHLPSLGFSSEIRNNIKSIGIIQNFQIGRICDIMDPNVEVIYISPVSLNAEVEEYYKKFILLDNYYRHNTTENFENIPKDFELDQLNFKTENGALSRFKIIVPDYINSFPNHNLSLSTLLKYSSQSMRQLKTLILNKKAYIVNSYTSFDDIIIANELKISIFGCDPYVHQFLHNKTNTKKIFIELKLDLPPNDIDILNIDQLYESLAQLMIENLHVEKWALKINNSFNSDGILLVNVTKMESYLFVLKEYNRYQERWNNKWAQEASFTKLVTELVYFISKNGQQIKPVYKSAKHFISKFLEHGGIIEAIVPSESYICCTVVVEISPDLSTKILVTADQIHSSHQSMVAETYSIPQTSINPEKLNKYTYLIVQKCIDHNVIGYVNIDFVTFYDTKDNQEITWVLDFSIRYDKLLSILKISNYFTRAEYNEINHSYQIEKEKINIVQPKSQKKSKLYQSRNCIDPRPNCRSVIASNQLFHSNLSVIQYGVFFQMCRANTIGYDINQRIGTSFAIVDAKYRQYLGMITVSDNIVDALKKYIKNLVIIHQEISSKTMQGSNNFMTLKNSLEKMLKLAEKNFEIAKDAI
ncbi:IQ domain-containing protein H [Intoshia linei]|uniref:IQ domain-containing protein H n=1 Tax=Intoshia linei TaxID=1819745 RepID=A0A177B2Y8_9BILA|nr:IQ domain-containing protein H [Intoshia linei]